MEIPRVKSYEQQMAEAWYARFCEHWDDVVGDDSPPSITEFDGEQMAEHPLDVCVDIAYERHLSEEED